MRKLLILFLLAGFVFTAASAYGEMSVNEPLKVVVDFETGNNFVYKSPGGDHYVPLGQNGEPLTPENDGRETNTDIYRYPILEKEEQSQGENRTYTHDGFYFRKLGILSTEQADQTRGYHHGNAQTEEGKVGYNDNAMPFTVSRADGENFQFWGSCFTPANYTTAQIVILGFSQFIDDIAKLDDIADLDYEKYADDLMFKLILNINVEVDAEGNPLYPEKAKYYDMNDYINELNPDSGDKISDYSVAMLVIASLDFDGHISTGEDRKQFVFDDMTFGVFDSEGLDEGNTPEPATLLILGCCGAALPFFARRKK